MLNIKFTPETIVMLPFALGLDIIGIVLICFGLDDFGITDIIGIMIIDSWLLYRGDSRSGNTKGRQAAINKASDMVTKLFKGKQTKFLIPALLELIPYLGSLFPFWTISVVLNLSKD